MFRSPAARVLLRSSTTRASTTTATTTSITKRCQLSTLKQPLRPRPRPRSSPSLQSSFRISGRKAHYSTNDSFWTRSKELYKRHPYQVTLAGVVIVFAAGCIAYANYLYQSYIIAAFHKYPEPVAKKLRRALYYTNTDLQPKEALRYYRQALELANEMGMDPFSDEIMGVKVQVASLMEQIRNYPKAIEVLEILKRDCLQWEQLLGGLERNKEKRTRVLKKAIAISIKLGELYSNEYINEPRVAEERLVWAVESTLREKQRRDRDGVKVEEEGDWMSDDEIGASMEALAHNYEAQDKHYLATPLFLQALSLKPTEDCHTVVLMNNLSISLAQQNPAALLTPSEAASAPTQKVLLQQATQWAQKALDVAAQIKPPVRDEECDLGCAVAMHNLGELAEMSGHLKAAGRKYKEAVALARAVGFEEGVENSSEALRRVNKAT